MKPHLTSPEDMEREIDAWAARRNAAVSTIRRQFTSADAWTALRRLYPTFDL